MIDKPICYSAVTNLKAATTTQNTKQRALLLLRVDDTAAAVAAATTDGSVLNLFVHVQFGNNNKQELCVGDAQPARWAKTMK